MNLRYDSQKLAEIAAREQVAFVVLFGSVAKGHADDRSDVDIGVCFQRYPEHPYDVFRRHRMPHLCAGGCAGLIGRRACRKPCPKRQDA